MDINHLKLTRHSSGVYAIICVINGKFYIGSSCRLLYRYRCHLSALRNHKHGNVHLQRAWDKYGEHSFVFHVLEYCTNDRLIDVEQQYLDRFQSFDPAVGYNIEPCASTPLGSKRTPEQIAQYKQRFLDTRATPFEVVGPTGIIFRGKNKVQFAKDAGLDLSSLYRLLKGKVRETKGWRLPTTPAKEMLLFQYLDPHGKEVSVSEHDLKSWCLIHGLRTEPMRKVWNKKIESYKGYSRFDRKDLYRTLVNEQGKELTFCLNDSFYKIARENGFGVQTITALLTGRSLHLCGWALKENTHLFVGIYAVRCPDGNIIRLSRGTLGKYAREHGLDDQKFYRVVQGHIKSYAGYGYVEDIEQKAA